MGKDVIAFAEQLERVAIMLKRSTVPHTGRKSLAQRARVELTDIKKNVTRIKKITMEY